MILYLGFSAGGAWARSRCTVPDGSDRDLMIRTVIGEARNQPYEGMVAVAAVIWNRVRGGLFGPSLRAVLARKRQFEPWSRHCHSLLKLSPRSPGWIEAALAVNEALNGYDPTGGATHFANIAVVLKRDNSKAIAWITDLTNIVVIGKHTFGQCLPWGHQRTTSHPPAARWIPATVGGALVAY